MATRHLLTITLLAATSLLAACANPQRDLREQGVAQYKAGNYAQALDTFNAALKYDPFSATDNYYAGMAAFRDNKLEQAAYHLKLAWQADPSMPEIKQALVETLIRQDKTDLALDYLDRDTKLVERIQDPRKERLVNKRRYMWEKEERMFLTKGANRAYVAETYARLGDYDNAKIYFDQAVKLDPRNPEILLAYGNMYAAAGRTDTAAVLYRQAYDLDPETPGLVEAMTKAGVMLNKVIN